jgi:dienelactone hydrolase
VTIETSTAQLPACVAQPTVDEPRPGVVVMHDAGCMSKDVRRQSNWLAKAEHFAVGPDLLSLGNRDRCWFATVSDLRSGKGRRSSLSARSLVGSDGRGVFTQAGVSGR